MLCAITYLKQYKSLQMKSIKYLALAGITLLGASCHDKNNNNNTVTPAADSSNVYLHLHTNLDSNEADYGAVYTTAEGRKLSIDKAQLYLSNIELVKSDGSLLTIPGKVILKVVETEIYFVAKVPVGNYKSINFHVGLDAVTNKVTPTSANAELNHSDMWFGAAAQPGGYIFLNFQGKIDTTTKANGTVAQMQPFMYMIGTDARYTEVKMPDHPTVYNVTKGTDQYIHITVDYYKLFSGIQLNNSGNLMIMSTADNAGSLAAKVAGNIPSMFDYEE